ncbi:phage antirepressor N-terminal domain-containing protein [Pseudomonas sp. Ps21-P2]|uniref:phage antirepressor N-terminal domain-containing protein n=1 Tax=Pseudomonas sp. Ps21-P2 TaxID=3080331 RepID=UPI003209AD26
MNAQLMPVPFRDDTVVLLGRDNEPYVAMRPVVENMGLAWQVQHRKINERFTSVVTEMVTTGDDGKQYAMTCLPLRKLAAWLYTINPKKVAPELHDKIIQYQEDCDEVLWNYWNHGQKQLIAMLEERAARILPLPGVTRTARDGINFKQLIILQEQGRNLASLLVAATDSFERQGLHNQLRQVNDALGLPTPPLEQCAVAIQRD